MVNRGLIVVLFAVAVCLGVSGQKAPNKPWTEWTLKEATKVLDNSGWGQVQVETDTSEMTFNPAPRSVASQGANNQSKDTNYHIRILSAKPIRQAFARVILLTQGTPTEQLTKRLTAMAEAPSGDFITIAVAADSKDGRYAGLAMEALNSANVGTLKNTTFLEDKNGTKVFLKDYRIPGKDALGAQFVFPRTVNEEPLITSGSNELHFYSEIPSAAHTDPNSPARRPTTTNIIKLNMRFKVADMMYNGKLEY